MRPQQVEFLEPVIEVYSDSMVTQSEIDWLTAELVGLAVAAVVTGAVQGLLVSMLMEALKEA